MENDDVRIEEFGRQERKTSSGMIKGADCRFVRVKNNLFRVEAIKSIRIEGPSLKVFLIEEMYAKVTFDTPEKAWACWEYLTREMCASRNARPSMERARSAEATDGAKENEQGDAEQDTGTDEETKKGLNRLAWWRD